MSCGCNNGPVNNWNDWQVTEPTNPLELIAVASLVGGTATFANSSTYATPVGSWVATNNITINSTPTCAALQSDNLQMVGDAAMWNFENPTRNTNANLVPQLVPVMFMRGGRQWAMSMQLALGGTTFTDLQLSFLDNAGTRGDSQGTIPVIQFSGSFTGNKLLTLTFNPRFGPVRMGLRAIDSILQYSFSEIDWIIVP